MEHARPKPIHDYIEQASSVATTFMHGICAERPDTTGVGIADSERKYSGVGLDDPFPPGVFKSFDDRVVED
jgi:hypothetical protein